MVKESVQAMQLVNLELELNSGYFGLKIYTSSLCGIIELSYKKLKLRFFCAYLFLHYNFSYVGKI